MKIACIMNKGKLLRQQTIHLPNKALAIISSDVITVKKLFARTKIVLLDYAQTTAPLVYTCNLLIGAGLLIGLDWLLVVALNTSVFPVFLTHNVHVISFLLAISCAVFITSETIQFKILEGNFFHSLWSRQR